MTEIAIPYALENGGRRIDAQQLVAINGEDKNASAAMRIKAVSEIRLGTIVYECPFCGQALYPHKSGTIHWQHFPGAHQKKFCVYGSKTPLSKIQLEGLVYRGRQVGHRHQEIVKKIVQLLRIDLSVNSSTIKCDEYVMAISQGEHGRFPDVQCELVNGTKVVFEVQTSPIFLYRIVDRQKFYRENSTYLIWITDDLTIGEKLPAYVYDFISTQDAVAFDLPDDIYLAGLADELFKLRSTSNLGTNKQAETKIVALKDLVDRKSQFARIWISRRSTFDSSDLPDDLETELVKIAKSDERFDKYHAVHACDWLLSIETGIPVGYPNIGLVGVVNAALGSNFGKQIATLLLRALQEFQPSLLKKPWIAKHVEDAAVFCEKHGLHIYGQNSWIDALRTTLLPRWKLSDTKQKNSKPIV